MLDRPFGRRSLLRGAGALTAASLAPWAGGCASEDDDALTFFFAANPEERDARIRIVDEFQRRHPGIKVRAVLSGPGVMQQLATFCAGGKCPDVLMAWELTYSELADRGVLLDLNTLLARDQAFAAQLKSDSIGALYESGTSRGVSTISWTPPRLSPSGMGREGPPSGVSSTRMSRSTRPGCSP